MNDYIYADYSMTDRVKMLQNLSIKSQTETYNRSLSDSEVDADTQKFASDAMELDRQKKQLKAETERMKAGITSMEKLMEERLERIRTRQVSITATLYGIPNYEKKTMNYYDGFGELIKTRGMTPDETQGKLFLGDEAKVTEFGNGVPVDNGDGGDHVTDVDFEEVPGDEKTLDQAVDEMYAEDGKSVAIDVKAPEESKPKKGSKKGKKDNEDNNPL